jgi:hypothetical protein
VLDFLERLIGRSQILIIDVPIFNYGRSVRRLIPLGFLAPRIVEAIAEGRQPVDLTVEALTRRIELPIFWSAQHQALGFK